MAPDGAFVRVGNSESEVLEVLAAFEVKLPVLVVDGPEEVEKGISVNVEGNSLESKLQESFSSYDHWSDTTMTIKNIRVNNVVQE